MISISDYYLKAAKVNYECNETHNNKVNECVNG